MSLLNNQPAQNVSGSSSMRGAYKIGVGLLGSGHEVGMSAIMGRAGGRSCGVVGAEGKNGSDMRGNGSGTGKHHTLVAPILKVLPHERA